MLCTNHPSCNSNFSGSIIMAFHHGQQNATPSSSKPACTKAQSEYELLLLWVVFNKPSLLAQHKPHHQYSSMMTINGSIQQQESPAVGRSSISGGDRTRLCS
jgi:hypothetical protein